MKLVLFACVHNAGRSQMAAALFNQLADPTLARAMSAGTSPGDQVHPEVVSVMREAGVDLAEIRPQRLTPALAKEAALLVTMGCGEACPVVPGVERDDWPLEDPKGKPAERVREIRDEIRRRVRALLAARRWAIPVGLELRDARLEDDVQLRAFLVAAGLPADDVESGRQEYLLACEGQRIVGSIGLESIGVDALARSLAVAPDRRGLGLGNRLLAAAVQRAHARGIQTLYALTTTAEAFAAAHGFVRIPRTEVPEAVVALPQFRALCPVTAVCMRLSLTPETDFSAGTGTRPPTSANTRS
jgi:arsenate reductase (thioredoxin)